MKKEIFERKKKAAERSAAYRNYIRVRECVFRMRAGEPEPQGAPSRYWKEELAGFEYMFDASPLVIEKLRHHCYHITGLYDYHYRAHHGHAAKGFEKKLSLLREKDKNGLLVSEHPALGGFGYTIGSALFNLDTFKYYECLIAMDRAGLLEQFRRPDEKKIVAEIGSGWGGLAYQFKTLFPNTAYVLVDFPHVFLFAGTYLKTLFPAARFLFLDGTQESLAISDISAYDFVFVPHYAWQDAHFTKPSLLINTVSFQEMTTKQVCAYARKAKEWGTPNVYSMNRDRSQHNSEIESVRAALEKYYAVREIQVLPIQASRLPKSRLHTALQRLKPALSRMTGWPKYKPYLEYRHLIGTA